MTKEPNLGLLLGTSGTNTFLGLEACLDLAKLNAPAALIGAPAATPYSSVGAYCRNAPAALRASLHSLAPDFDRHDFEFGEPLFPSAASRPVDCGDLPFDEADAPGNRERIKAAVSLIRSRGAVPVVIGGDDSVPIPMLEALGPEPGLTVLQIDAHIDWRDVHMGERLGLSSTMRRASEMAHVARIIQVGARGSGSATASDYRNAVAAGAHFITAEQLHRDGVACALELIPQGGRVVICFDVDALDPSIMPGVIGRLPGGLSYWQAVDLIRGAARRARIAAMDFVEFMPERDVDGIGARTFGRLVATALGVAVRQPRA